MVILSECLIGTKVVKDGECYTVTENHPDCITLELTDFGFHRYIKQYCDPSLLVELYDEELYSLSEIEYRI
jgi:hypothetical protein